MEQLTIGALAPDFTLPGTGGQEVTLSNCRGSKVVLFFYPKDNTPGWTDEAREFREQYEKIVAMNAVVFGISRDSLASHEKFAAKLELPFVLLSDQDETVCRQYDVLKEKNMYGKKVMGVERSTFLIDESGVMKAIFRKVKVEGHAAQITAVLSTL